MTKPSRKDYKKIARELKNAGLIQLDLRKKFDKRIKARLSKLAQKHLYPQEVKSDKPEFGKTQNYSRMAFNIRIPENTREVYAAAGFRTQKTGKGVYAEIPNNKKYTRCRATKKGYTLSGAGITVAVWFMPPHLAERLIKANLPGHAPHGTAWCAKIGSNSASFAQMFAVRKQYLKWLFTASKSNDDAPINYSPVFQHCKVEFKL